jgi:hypothetical protein
VAKIGGVDIQKYSQA